LHLNIECRFRISIFEFRIYSIVFPFFPALMQMVASDTHSPHRVLVIHQGALGDFILTFPALALLKHQIGPVDVLCRSGLGRVADRLGLSECHYSIDAAAFVSLFTTAVDHPASRILSAYDTILLLSFSESVEDALRCCLTSRIVRIPPRPRGHQKIHVAEFIVDALRTAGLVHPSGDWAGIINREGQQHRRNVDPDRVLLHPGAGSLEKRWPLTHVRALFGRLQNIGMDSVIILGPAEWDLAPLISDDWDSAPIRRISDLDLLMDTLEGAGGLIGNDSGVSHLSAWMEVPTVACFGPTDPICWRPLGPRVEIVQPSRRHNDADFPGDLSRISPEQVLEAWLNLRHA